MTLEDGDEVDTGTEDGTGSEEDSVAEGEEAGEEATEGAEQETKDGEKLPGDWPEGAIKRIGKLTAKRHEAEERAAEAETARDAAKAEAEKLAAKYGDREILKAAKTAGVLPELLTTEQAALLTKADKLERHLEQIEQTLEDHPEGYEADGQQVTPAMLRGWRRNAKEQLDDVRDDAAALRKQKADEVRELIRLGREAKAGGGKKPAAPSQAAGKPPPKVSPVKGTPPAAGAGAPRRPTTGTQMEQKGDIKGVKGKDDLVSLFRKEYGG